MYRTVPKHQKIIVSRSIISAVGKQNPPGRFLERDKGSKLWYEVPFERAVEKAKQALRERGRGEEDEDDDDDYNDHDDDYDAAAGAGGEDDDSQGSERRAAGVAAAGAAAGPTPSHIPSSSNIAVPHQIIGLSPTEEVVAIRFRNMLRFNVDPSVVESKMKNEGISERIISSVLLTGAGGGGGAVPPPQIPIAQPPPLQPQPQPAVLEHHVQFAKGTNAAASVPAVYASVALSSAQQQQHSSNSSSSSNILVWACSRPSAALAQSCSTCLALVMAAIMVLLLPLEVVPLSAVVPVLLLYLPRLGRLSMASFPKVTYGGRSAVLVLDLVVPVVLVARPWRRLLPPLPMLLLLLASRKLRRWRHQ